MLKDIQPSAEVDHFNSTSTKADSSESSTIQGKIRAVRTSSGCSSYGRLDFSANSTDTGICVNYNNTFNIQSNAESSQLGAFLVFYSVGGFYTCGTCLDVRGNCVVTVT